MSYAAIVPVAAIVGFSDIDALDRQGKLDAILRGGG